MSTPFCRAHGTLKQRGNGVSCFTCDNGVILSLPLLLPVPCPDCAGTGEHWYCQVCVEMDADLAYADALRSLGRPRNGGAK